ncbi:MAG TPA: pyruvate formate lyase-activating protein [Clostridiaceae bacterium]|nr:pyruvate formate lyase-activating protein [Clostridiaceae bacterium]
MIKGRVHSFETFGTVDGPGIRFVVFMQGCPLRCIYCHNRDMWDTCGGKEYTPDEIINELSKYLNYIKPSGGGITITGGEPTLQAEFVSEVFKKCREINVHTALDTSGHAPIEKVKTLLQYTDLILLDIKQASEEKHRQITGVGRDTIVKFATYASEKGIPIWIRYVLIPGYNDDKEDLELAAQFISTLKTVQKVNVLPYHNLGEYKWEKLGEKYSLKGLKSPGQEQAKKAEEILLKALPLVN